MRSLLPTKATWKSTRTEAAVRMARTAINRSISSWADGWRSLPRHVTASVLGARQLAMLSRKRGTREN